jgi:hypothetical protein
MVKVEEKYFRINTGLYAYYVNFYAMMWFKCTLQLKFKKHKNYSYIIVNFHTGL